METPEQISSRWYHRKRMAWLSFAYLILIIPLLAVLSKMGFIDDKWMSAMQPVIIAVVGGVLGIIGAYIGFSTLHDIKNSEET